MKDISINDSIFQLVTTYPKIKEILFSLGFIDIVKPGMLQTVGRVMTLSKGSKVKDISLENIKEAFKAQGFNIKELLWVNLLIT